MPALRQNACVAIFSLEMSGEELVTRTDFNRSQRPFNSCPLGMHSEMDERKILSASVRLSETKIYIGRFAEAAHV